MIERRRKIIKELSKAGRVQVSELSKKFACSEVTIRNDIRALAEEGLLLRTHGGAIKKEEERVSYRAESLYRNVDEKQIIAKRAYDFIEEGDTIFIDDASSSFYLALYIKTHSLKRLSVVTNSLFAANELAYTAHVDLYMVGGHVGGHLAASMGDDALHNIERFKIDKGFIGVHSINFDVGITSIANPQMQIKKSIIRSSRQVYVLADHSKFGSGYVSVICGIKEIDQIITDERIEETYIDKAKELSIPLLIAKGD